MAQFTACREYLAAFPESRLRMERRPGAPEGHVGLDNRLQAVALELTLDTLPGVHTTDELGSALSVRGLGPESNLILLDGVELYKSLAPDICI